MCYYTRLEATFWLSNSATTDRPPFRQLPKLRNDVVAERHDQCCGELLFPFAQGASGANRFTGCGISAAKKRTDRYVSDHESPPPVSRQ